MLGGRPHYCCFEFWTQSDLDPSVQTKRGRGSPDGALVRLQIRQPATPSRPFTPLKTSTPTGRSKQLWEYCQLSVKSHVLVAFFPSGLQACYLTVIDWARRSIFHAVTAARAAVSCDPLAARISAATLFVEPALPRNPLTANGCRLSQEAYLHFWPIAGARK